MNNEVMAVASPPVVLVAPPPAKANKPRKGIMGLCGWSKCGGDSNLVPQPVIVQRRADMRAALSGLRVWGLAFSQVHGRKPRAYDLFTGEGDMAHGLALAGFEVRGVELVTGVKTQLHTAPIRTACDGGCTEGGPGMGGCGVCIATVPGLHYHD